MYEKNKHNKELAKGCKHFLKSSDDDLYIYYALLKILKRYPIISEENINFLVMTEFLEKKEKKGESEILTKVIGRPFVVENTKITPLESLIVGKPVKEIEGHYTDTDGSRIQCKALMIHNNNDVINVTCREPKKNKKPE